jgi:hypothetical protein
LRSPKFGDGMTSATTHDSDGNARRDIGGYTLRDSAMTLG